MKKKSLLYTKTGDKGETSLYGGERVKKSSPRILAIGNIDELNSAIGVVCSQIKVKKIESSLEKIQGELFEIGAEIASPAKTSSFKLEKEKVSFLEVEIDSYDSLVPELKNFILPGGSYQSALLQQARSICRRAERETTKLKNLNPNILKYLNRLSDLLFVLARFSNKLYKVEERLWKKSLK